MKLFKSKGAPPVDSLDPVTQKFVKDNPYDCSITLVTQRQKRLYWGFVLCMLALAVVKWEWAIVVVTTFATTCYMSSVYYKLHSVILSYKGKGEYIVPDGSLDSLKDEDLPIYTLLIPLYKEANIAGKIVRNLNQLDYPREKLDIKLLLEEDDIDTILAIKETKLDDSYDVIIVPDNQPKTKPRACNFGLKHAKGDFCVIYDAEDRPEADQLKKVVYAFNQLGEQTACIQAKLNYYNQYQNMLTRWFAVEYTTIFDLYLPGLQTMKIPVPLGGTSNHFRTDLLKQIGGWDPFNVTEDCDLGIRIYKRGFETKVIDSTTWEEANSDTWNWIRQRSRWVKGYFQTHLTHMRYPRRTLQELGWRGLFGFYMAVGAGSAMILINLIFWIVGITRVCMGLGWNTWHENNMFWEALVISANITLILVHVLAAFKRKNYKLLFAAFTMPIYWVLISIGGWKGFLQLFTKPFYWEKTIHGLDGDEFEPENITDGVAEYVPEKTKVKEPV